MWSIFPLATSQLILSKHKKSKQPKSPHPIFLAQRFQQLLRSDKVNTRPSWPGSTGSTRAPVTQIVNLMKLPLAIRTQIVQMPPDEQEYFTKKVPENCKTAIRLKAAGGIRSA